MSSETPGEPASVWIGDSNSACETVPFQRVRDPERKIGRPQARELRGISAQLKFPGQLSGLVATRGHNPPGAIEYEPMYGVDAPFVTGQLKLSPLELKAAATNPVREWKKDGRAIAGRTGRKLGKMVRTG
jgi:hypothetical protein